MDFIKQQRKEQMKEVNKVYKEFWKPIFGFFGLLNFRQVKRELSDFHMCCESVPEVYMAVTNGCISKANTHAHAVIGEFENYLSEYFILKSDLKDILENYKGRDLRRELENIIK